MPKKAPAKKVIPPGSKFWTKAFREPIPQWCWDRIYSPDAGIEIHTVGAAGYRTIVSVSSESKEDVKVCAKQAWKAYQDFMTQEAEGQKAFEASLLSSEEDDEMSISDDGSNTLSFSAAPSPRMLAAEEASINKLKALFSDVMKVSRVCSTVNLPVG